MLWAPASASPVPAGGAAHPLTVPLPPRRAACTVAYRQVEKVAGISGGGLELEFIPEQHQACCSNETFIQVGGQAGAGGQQGTGQPMLLPPFAGLHHWIAVPASGAFTYSPLPRPRRTTPLTSCRAGLRRGAPTRPGRLPTQPSLRPFLTSSACIALRAPPVGPCWRPRFPRQTSPAPQTTRQRSPRCCLALLLPCQR